MWILIPYSEHAVTQCVCFLCVFVCQFAFFFLPFFYYFPSSFVSIVFFNFNFIFLSFVHPFISSFLCIFYSFFLCSFHCLLFVYVRFFLSMPMVFTWQMNVRRVASRVSPANLVFPAHNLTRISPLHSPSYDTFPCPFHLHLLTSRTTSFLHSVTLKGRCIIATRYRPATVPLTGVIFKVKK